MNYFLLTFLIGSVVHSTNGQESLHPNNGIQSGNWGPVEYCPAGTHVRGLQCRYKDNAGLDAVGITGVRLYCESDSVGITSDYGQDGTFQQIYLCPSGGLVIGLQLNVNPNKLDELGVEDIRVLCLNPNGVTTSLVDCLVGVSPETNDIKIEAPQEEIKLGTNLIQSENNPRVDDANWGDMPLCSISYAVCGLQTRIAANGLFRDNLGMTDVIFICCTNVVF